MPVAVVPEKKETGAFDQSEVRPGKRKPELYKYVVKEKGSKIQGKKSKTMTYGKKYL